MSLAKHRLELVGRRLLDKHGLCDWALFVVDYELRPGNIDSLGFCSHPAKAITVRRHKDFRQTLLHEIAHALVPEDAGHGQLWQRKAAKIGVNLEQILYYVYQRDCTPQRMCGEKGDKHMNMTKEIEKLKVQEHSYFVARKEFKRAARNLLNKAQKHLAPHVSVTKPTEAALEIFLDDFMSSNTRVV